MSFNLDNSLRVAIVGGGISGLASAFKLQELGTSHGVPVEVRIYESTSKTGGIVGSIRRDGFLMEAGPDSFISEKPEALDLARRIGIADRIIQTRNENRRSFIVRDGKLNPVPEGFNLLAPSSFWPFLISPIFSWRGKARMALDLLLPRSKSRDESLASFVRRRLGTEALDRMAQPMVGGIYTADPEKLSLRATMPRFLEMEYTHRSVIRAMYKKRRTQPKEESSGVSGPRYSMFLSFDEGMQVLTDNLSSKLYPGTIRTGVRISTLSRGPGDQWTLASAAGDSWQADAVVIALPAYGAADLLEDTNRELALELNTIPYASTATMNVAFRRKDIQHPLNGFGFVVPFTESRNILACSFSSVKFAGRAPEDYVLLRAFAGGALQPEVFALDDEALISAVLQDLKELLGTTAGPLFTHIERWKQSMPQYHIGHLDHVKKIKELAAAIPGLQLAGNAYHGAGIPDCIRSGETAAMNIFQQALPRDPVHS
jgi:protoporphyrinogen/coproporphyrinogen III oxidase